MLLWRPFLNTAFIIASARLFNIFKPVFSTAPCASSMLTPPSIQEAKQPQRDAHPVADFHIVQGQPGLIDAGDLAGPLVFAAHLDGEGVSTRKSPRAGAVTR
jgi:hypothetical protein